MEPMNREQRRHPEKLEQEADQVEPPDHRDSSGDPDAEMRSRARTQDDLSVRAKNSGHGKKTADKWNQ